MLDDRVVRKEYPDYERLVYAYIELHAHAIRLSKDVQNHIKHLKVCPGEILKCKRDLLSQLEDINTNLNNLGIKE